MAPNNSAQPHSLLRPPFLPHYKLCWAMQDQTSPSISVAVVKRMVSFINTLSFYVPIGSLLYLVGLRPCSLSSPSMPSISSCFKGKHCCMISTTWSFTRPTISSFTKPLWVIFLKGNVVLKHLVNSTNIPSFTMCFIFGKTFWCWSMQAAGRIQMVWVSLLKENWQLSAQPVIILVKICPKDGTQWDLYHEFIKFSWYNLFMNFMQISLHTISCGQCKLQVEGKEQRYQQSGVGSRVGVICWRRPLPGTHFAICRSIWGLCFLASLRLVFIHCDRSTHVNQSTMPLSEPWSGAHLAIV